MKTVFILFTKHKDWFAQFLSVVRHHHYTHVSLSINDDHNVFYSFNVKGFCSETIEKHRKHGITQIALYQLQVADNVYTQIETELQKTITHKDEMKYSFVGVVLTLLHIPFHWKNRYFCSEFIATLLKKSGAVHLHRSPSLYLPEQLLLELDKRLTISRLLNVV